MFRILKEADRMEIEVIGACLMSNSTQLHQLKDIINHRSTFFNTNYGS